MRFIALLLSFCASVFAAPSLQVIPDQLYLRTLLEVLSNAKERIDILQFSFAADKVGSSPNQVADKLIALKKERPNLKIRLYIEGERDTATRNKITADYLSKNGIEVKEGKTHAKGFVVDEATLLIGSTNLTAQSIERNNETNLLLKEYPQIAKGFTQYFDSLWNNETRKPFAFPKTPEAGVQLLTDGLYKEKIIEAISQAAKTIDFSIYYFNDVDIEKALIAAATKKNVKVRGYVNQHRSFALELVERNRKTVQRLHDAGLHNIYFDIDTFFSHSKYIIVDGQRLLLGTGNWNRSDVEEHPQVYFDVENVRAADKLSRHLSHQIAYESSRPIPKRPLVRFYNGFAITDTGFDAVIRDRFIRATVKTGEGGGLIGYLPALTARKDSDSKGLYPDEVALVIYQDEPTYRAIRESSVGEVYGPLHNDYFLPSPKSKSTVPSEYQGSIEANAAYDLSNEGFDWQKAHVLFVYTRKKANSDFDAAALASYVTEVSSARLSEGHLIYAGQDYLLEYFGKGSTWTEANWKRIDAIRTKHLVSYDPPIQIAAAYSSTFTDNGLTRPERSNYKSFKAQKGASVINTVINHQIGPEKNINNSLFSFARNEAEDAALREQIKKSFVEALPVPTIDE